MVKLSIALLGLLLLPEKAFSQEQRVIPTLAKHCLWKVEGRSNTVYLLGSIHFFKKDLLPLPSVMEAAYRNADVVMFEADLDELNSPEGQAQFARQSKVPEGETLDQQVSKKTYDQLQSYLTKKGLPGKSFESLRPWMTGMVLWQIELKRLGYEQELGLDQYFFTRAKEDNKTRVALESLDTHFNVFRDLSKEEQDFILEQTLVELADSKKMISELIEAWKTGDAKKLEKQIIDSLRGHPNVRKRLVVDPNRQWAEKVEKVLIDGKNALVVVGAAHLVGEESLLDFLSRKGFKSQQL